MSLGVTGQLSAQVTASGTETQVNTTTANSQQRPDVAMDTSGNYVVVWEDFGADEFGHIHLEMFPCSS